MIRALQIIAAVAIPLAAFAIANRRHLDVGLAFIHHELSNRVHFIVFVLTIVMGALGWLFVRSLNSKSVRAAFVFSLLRNKYVGRWWTLPILCFAVFCLIAPYGYSRYRSFSEVVYQEKALSLLLDGRVMDADLICRKYVALFPQRRASGGLPDPVCTPITNQVEDVRGLELYLSEVDPKPRTVDGFHVPIDWNARVFGRTLIRVLLVGEDSTELERLEVKGVPIVYPPWRTFSSPIYELKSSNLPDLDDGSGRGREVMLSDPGQNVAAEELGAEPIKAHQIQLVAVRSLERARTEIEKLKQRLEAVLGGVVLRVFRADHDVWGVVYRIRAGPIGTLKEARQLCADVKAQDQECEVVIPGR